MRDAGVEDVDFYDGFEISCYTWNDELEFYISPSDSHYVDHGKEAMDFVEAVCTDKDLLLHYLFSPKSFVLTGNDNDDNNLPYEYSKYQPLKNYDVYVK